MAIILIAIGVVAVVRYGIGTFNAYRAVQYARQNNFDAGNPDPDLLRPWMNMQYVAVAYTVPQEFLFAELGIPFERRSSRASLADLNDRFNFGRATDGDRPYPLILDRLKAAIIKYRENPIPTGLERDGVRPWMSVQYIANSTGIPAEVIFEQIDVPMDGNAFLPLDALAGEARYQGGPRALVENIQQVVDTYEAAE